MTFRRCRKFLEGGSRTSLRYEIEEASRVWKSDMNGCELIYREKIEIMMKAGSEWLREVRSVLNTCFLYRVSPPSCEMNEGYLTFWSTEINPRYPFQACIASPYRAHFPVVMEKNNVWRFLLIFPLQKIFSPTSLLRYFAPLFEATFSLHIYRFAEKILPFIALIFSAQTFFVYHQNKFTL